jgi:hypothetical protein
MLNLVNKKLDLMSPGELAQGWGAMSNDVATYRGLLIGWAGWQTNE